MLKSYFKTAWRSLWRQKVFSFINITGLGVGLSCCLLIVLFIRDELAFDKFHTHKGRIYRVLSEISKIGEKSGSVNITNGWPLGRFMKEKYPEVEEMVYMRQPQYPIKHNGQYFFENIISADESLFRVFSFPLLKGNPKTALAQPNTLVLTEKMARKYFGSTEAVGQTLMLNDTLPFQVTGVVKDVPKQSHIQFDILVSFATFKANNPDFYENQGWFDLNMYNYVLLREGTDVAAFEKKVSGMAMQEAGKFYNGFGYDCKVLLQPFSDVYLQTAKIGNGLGPSTNINYMYMLGVIAIFILLIACINFMNLATARSVKRAKEVGVRKVIGSSKGALVRQFLTESFLTCFLAFVLAIELAVLAIPYFNELSGKSIAFTDLLSTDLLLILLGLLVVVSILAGLYPAFVLANFRPIQVLKGTFAGAGGVTLRQGLVVFQFAISCALILATVVVTRQLRYMQKQDLGFNKEQVLVIDAALTSFDPGNGKYRALKQALAAHATVKSVAAGLAVPGRSGWGGQLVIPEGKLKEQMLSVEYLAADEDFVQTLGLQLLAGRSFSADFRSDKGSALLLNEAAVKEMDFGTPAQAIGKHIDSPSGFPKGIVVGVVKDYHQHGLQEKIRPVVFDFNPSVFQTYAIRMQPSNVPATLAHVQKVCDQFFNGYKADYFFLDEDFARQYQQETRLAKIFATFSCLSIFIACLGLFGLVAFTTVQRTKEIGIRKVLGASVSNIMVLLAKDFMKLVMLANVIAWPLAWWGMNKWLQDFAYRTQISWWIFALTGGVALLITLFTVGMQAFKAAAANPVHALKNE